MGRRHASHSEPGVRSRGRRYRRDGIAGVGAVGLFDERTSVDREEGKIFFFFFSFCCRFEPLSRSLSVRFCFGVVASLFDSRSLSLFYVLVLLLCYYVIPLVSLYLHSHSLSLSLSLACSFTSPSRSFFARVFVSRFWLGLAMGWSRCFCSSSLLELGGLRWTEREMRGERLVSTRRIERSSLPVQQRAVRRSKRACIQYKSSKK